jgi:hypothetical protein
VCTYIIRITRTYHIIYIYIYIYITYTVTAEIHIICNGRRSGMHVGNSSSQLGIGPKLEIRLLWLQFHSPLAITTKPHWQHRTLYRSVRPGTVVRRRLHDFQLIAFNWTCVVRLYTHCMLYIYTHIINTRVC